VSELLRITDWLPILMEPEGWVRSVPDMRRRPDGDPAREYVQGDQRDPYRQRSK
jgi:hypothetical protein